MALMVAAHVVDCKLFVLLRVVLETRCGGPEAAPFSLKNNEYSEHAGKADWRRFSGFEKDC